MNCDKCEYKEDCINEKYCIYQLVDIGNIKNKGRRKKKIKKMKIDDENR